MIEQAKEEIRREKEAALVQLRTEVADLAIMAAGKILDANLDTPKQRQLVDAAIKELTRVPNDEKYAGFAAVCRSLMQRAEEHKTIDAIAQDLR